MINVHICSYMSIGETNCSLIVSYLGRRLRTCSSHDDYHKFLMFASNLHLHPMLHKHWDGETRTTPVFLHTDWPWYTNNIYRCQSCPTHRQCGVKLILNQQQRSHNIDDQTSKAAQKLEMVNDGHMVIAYLLGGLNPMTSIATYWGKKVNQTTNPYLFKNDSTIITVTIANQLLTMINHYKPLLTIIKH